MPRTCTKPSPRDTPPPITLVQLGGWRDRAVCRNHPTLPASTWDDSVPADGRGGALSHRRDRIASAIAVCLNSCPVVDECRAAVDLDYDEGVRGGEDIRDLWAATRRRRPA